jgi:hypothetical protein
VPILRTIGGSIVVFVALLLGAGACSSPERPELVTTGDNGPSVAGAEVGDDDFADQVSPGIGYRAGLGGGSQAALEVSASGASSTRASAEVEASSGAAAAA